MYKLTLSLAALLLSTASATIVAQSSTSTVTFTNGFSAEWSTYVDENSKKWLRMTLALANTPATSTWTTIGGGYWLAVGFGNSAMAGADIVLCEYSFTGDQASDAFSCKDTKASGHSLPTDDV